MVWIYHRPREGRGPVVLFTDQDQELLNSGNGGSVSIILDGIEWIVDTYGEIMRLANDRSIEFPARDVASDRVNELPKTTHQELIAGLKIQNNNTSATLPSNGRAGRSGTTIA